MLKVELSRVERPPVTDVTEPVSLALKSFSMVQSMVYPLPAGLAQLAVALMKLSWAKDGVANATRPTTARAEASPPCTTRRKDFAWRPVSLSDRSRRR